MTHDHCPHALRLCATCDVVYCATCRKEWGGHSHTWLPYYWQQPTYPWQQPTTYPQINTLPSIDVTSGGTATVSRHIHEQ